MAPKKCIAVVEYRWWFRLAAALLWQFRRFRLISDQAACCAICWFADRALYVVRAK